MMTIAELIRQMLMILIDNGMCLILLDRKYSLKKTLTVYGILTAAMAILSLPVTLLFGQVTFLFFHTVIVKVSTLATLFSLSKRKSLSVLFTMLTVSTIATLSITLAGYLATMLELSVWLEILTRILIYIPIIILLYRVLRPSYLKMLTVIKKGWGYLCLIPGLYYILILYNTVTLPSAPKDRQVVVFISFLTLLIVIVSYGVIFTLFARIIRESEMHDKQEFLKIEMQTMEKQVDLLKENEEKVRIYRHDLRHYLANVKVLLESGNTEEALQVLGSFDEQLKEKRISKIRTFTTD